MARCKWVTVWCYRRFRGGGPKTAYTVRIPVRGLRLADTTLTKFYVGMTTLVCQSSRLRGNNQELPKRCQSDHPLKPPLALPQTKLLSMPYLGGAVFAIGMSALAGLYPGCSSPGIAARPSPQLTLAKTAPIAPDISCLSNEMLIDRLQEESEQGVGTHATAWVTGFLPLATPGQFAGGVLGSPAPSKSQVMTELVSRGLAAMPALLDHLSDARPTKLSAAGSSGFTFMGAWFSDEYDYRFFEKDRHPAGVHPAGPGAARRDLNANYTLKVGDLCYVVIGQIVNRNLNAVQYQPTACLIVNSPIEYPALARATRADWSGLTAEQHDQSLQADLNAFSVYGRPSEAIQRLLFFYPLSGRKRVDPLLKRKVFDEDAVYDFISNELLKAPAERQELLIARFREKHGAKDYAGLQSDLEFLATVTDPQRTTERQRSAELVSRLFADGRSHLDSMDQYIGHDRQDDLVRALEAFRWDGLEEGILAIFRDAAGDSPRSTGGRIRRCNLALSCARRLIHQGHDEELARFFSALVDQIKRFDESAPDNQGNSLGNTGDASAFSLKITQCETFLQELRSRPVR
jgi:hypothetical protein